jgi:predicted MFS family arabinose efflux permease
MIVLCLVRASACGGIWAVLALGGGMLPVYVLAAVSQIAFTPFRGTHSAMLPSLCRTPHELTQVNVVRGALDSLSIVIGPFLAADIVAVSDVSWVFALVTFCALAAALLLIGITYERMPAARDHHVMRELGEGIRHVAKTRSLRLVVSLMALQTAIRGAYTVLVVVVTIDLLRRSDSLAGVLQATLGVGAFIGALLCARLTRGSTMARWLGIGILFWSLPLALIGVFPTYATAMVASALIGCGKATVDLAAFTLIRRTAPDRILARVFGALESIIALSVGIASFATPLLINALGTEDALLIIGLVPSAFVLIAWRGLTHLDHAVTVSTRSMETLRAVPMLRPLPIAALEALVRRMRHLACESGHVVFSAGDRGSAFYVVAKGTVEVRDGDDAVRRLGPGAGFGEIALLSDVRRTMTVVAVEDTELLEIDRSDFLSAVTNFGDAGSRAYAAREAHLAHSPGLASA